MEKEYLCLKHDVKLEGLPWDSSLLHHPGCRLIFTAAHGELYILMNGKWENTKTAELKEDVRFWSQLADMKIRLWRFLRHRT